MASVSAVNQKSVDPVNAYQQEDQSTTLTSTKEAGFEGARARGPGRWRRVGVVALGVILATVACGIIALAFVQGSWWYSYGTDRTLSHESRARVEAIRDEVDASGTAPEAVKWLNAALEPGAHPTDVRARLLAAQEVLEATDDPKLVKAASELRGIIQKIQRPPVKDTATPYLVSTPE